MIEISSRAKVFDDFYSPTESDDVVKNEPMFFGCDLQFAFDHGGSITRKFIEKIDVSSLTAVFDSRVHMLMPGWYPCIPGFHHDDVERSRVDGQPNYNTASYRCNHIMGLVNGDICPTEFAVGDAEFSDVPIGEVIYRKWHAEVESAIDTKKLSAFHAPSGKLIWFDDRTWHRGTQAIRTGWRWFGRVTFGSKRKHVNEIRKQVQVYLPTPNDGW